MVVKSLKISGKDVYLHPVKYKGKEYADCDINGEVLKKKITGRGTTTYHKADGTEVPKGMVFKLYELPDGTKKPMKPLIATKEVNPVVVDEVDLKAFQNVEMMHIVNTSDKTIREDILEKKKSYTFPFTNGNGFKVYRAVMTEFEGKIVIYGCLGNAKNKVREFNYDEEITLESGTIASMKEIESMMDF